MILEFSLTSSILKRRCGMKNMIKIIALSAVLLFAVNTALAAGELQQHKSKNHKKASARKNTPSRKKPTIVVKKNNNKPKVVSRKSTPRPLRYTESKKNNTTSSSRRKSGSTLKKEHTSNTNSGITNSSKTDSKTYRYIGSVSRRTTNKPEVRTNDNNSRSKSDYSRKAIPKVNTTPNYVKPKSTIRPSYKSLNDSRRIEIKRRGYETGSGSKSTTSRANVNPQDRRAVSRNADTNHGKAVTIRSKPASSGVYRGTHVVRTRKGSFDIGKNVLASRDKRIVGSIRMRNSPSMKGTASSGLVRTKGGGVRRFDYAKPDLVHNNYRFVDRDHSGNYMVSRHYLFDCDGRWGHAPTYYNGRNYHFYATLMRQGFYFGVGSHRWSRRYYGDGWDYHFGWNSGIYIPTGSWSYGTSYFEPCYAFTFTFNHGYERGYLEGYLTGVRHWNTNQPYNSYFGNYVGYSSYLGPFAEYIDGYEQGFTQGYYAGYSGLGYGYQNFGFGDFTDYPVIYDYDYDYYSNAGGYDDEYYYENNQGYEYDDEYSNRQYRNDYPDQESYRYE